MSLVEINEWQASSRNLFIAAINIFLITKISIDKLAFVFLTFWIIRDIR